MDSLGPIAGLLNSPVEIKFFDLGEIPASYQTRYVDTGYDGAKAVIASIIFQVASITTVGTFILPPNDVMYFFRIGLSSFGALGASLSSSYVLTVRSDKTTIPDCEAYAIGIF